MTAERKPRFRINDADREALRAELAWYDLALWGRFARNADAIARLPVLRRLVKVEGMPVSHVARHARAACRFWKNRERTTRRCSRTLYTSLGWAAMDDWLRLHADDLDPCRETAGSVARRMGLHGVRASWHGAMEAMQLRRLDVRRWPDDPPADFRAPATPKPGGLARALGALDARREVA